MLRLEDFYKQRRIVFYIFLFVGAFSFRVLGMNSDILNSDEWRVTSVVNKDFKGIISHVVEWDSHPPLNHLFIKLWTSVSRSILWIKMFYILTGSFVCILIFAVGISLFDFQTAFVSYILSVISPQCIFYSYEFRPYGVAVLFSTAAVLFFLNYLRYTKRLFLLWFILFGVMSAYTFYYSFFILMALYVGGIYYSRKNKNLGQFILLNIAFITIALLYLPWVGFQLKQMARFMAEDASSSTLDLKKMRMGIYFGRVQIGVIGKALAGLFHIDDFFLSKVRFSEHLSVGLFIVLLLFFAIGFIYLVKRAFKYLKNKEKFNQATHFVSFIIVASVLLMVSYSLAGDLGIVKPVAFNARYFGQSSVFFLFIISGFILSFTVRPILRNLFFMGFALPFLIFSLNQQFFKGVEYKRALDILKKEGVNTILTIWEDFPESAEFKRNFKHIHLASLNMNETEFKRQFQEAGHICFINVNSAEFIAKNPNLIENLRDRLSELNYLSPRSIRISDMLYLYIFEKKKAKSS